MQLLKAGEHGKHNFINFFLQIVACHTSRVRYYYHTKLWNVNLTRAQVFQDDEAYRCNDFILTLSILMLIHVGGRAMRYKHFSIHYTKRFDIQRNIMDGFNVWFRTFDTRYRLFDFYCTRKTCSIHRIPWR